MSPLSQLDLLSCGAHELYGSGGFYESPQTLAELALKSDNAIGLCAPVFAPLDYSRELPAHIFTSSDHERSLRAHFDEINHKYRGGAASWLVKIDSALLAHNVLYVQHDPSQRKVIYETYRPTDRADSPLLNPSDQPTRFERERSSIQLFLGSVGSFNYGHWLTDDVARLRSFRILREMFPHHTIEILLPSYGSGPEPHFAPWNALRADAIRFFLRGERRLRITFFDVKHPYAFDELYYTTPVSYHPVQKSREALQLVAERFTARRLFRWRRSFRRIFVTRRRMRERTLENIDVIESMLAQRGFRTVDTEGMSVCDQAALFAKADVIVGVMGAAMTNTIFSPAGARVLHLGLEGWNESYYWDLASLLGQTYVGCYGPPRPTTGPAHMASFHIPEARLEQALKAVGE